ncbi:MAG: hypothetical protein KJO41_02070 [Bacteroidia bacterium]|nr:hypothetical protein [Bacteroidia bacterium]NND26585.1 hypothetical protein [Flavobacteriaceae bacterium]MBT8277760.1 hypothetical protein [Bacteroidia bacterium]NNK61443.1 hypothetical protein [Flavobacteriaceae bacterium]NNL33169.1 hypothetical protein [Flavobacteriaceae bacterium]
MIKKLCLVFVVLSALNVYSQEGTTSPYSFYGIGSLKFKGTAENRSMAGLSIYADSIHVNLKNPATFAGNNVKISPFNNESRPVKFTVGGTHSSTKLKTNDASDKASSTTFNYLAISVPMGKAGFTFGLLPYTSVGYRLDAKEMLMDSLVTKNRYRGEGGVNRAFLGLGYQLTKDLSIGADASYNFGNIQNTTIEFLYDDEGEPLQYQSREQNRSDLSGINFNLGIYYTPMINEKLKLFSGLTYSPSSDLKSQNERVFATIVINPNTGQEFEINEIDADLESVGLDRTTLNLPSKFSFGVGIGRERRWFLGAEYTSLKTSEFSNRIFDIENATFEDASTFAFGGFYIPQYTSFNKYWKRVVYRAGVRFENTGLKINNESINEFGISFGVGLPVGRMFSNANLGFEVGQRGTTNQNLVQENFINFQLSLSLNDRWFVKRKFN